VTGLVGTLVLARLILRRDRVVLAVWVSLLAIMMVGFAAGIQGLYPTSASRLEFAGSVAANPSLTAFYGPVFSPTVGGITAWRSVWVLLGVAIAALLMITRHTRAEEEIGRRELIGSTVVGRHASMAAALVVMSGSMVALAGLIVLGLVGRGLPVAGSVAVGMAVATFGTVFGSVAALCAQLTQSARSARGIAAGVLSGAFLLRVTGDLSSESWLSWLSWGSPFGLVQQIRPFADERWWLFGPLVALVVLLVGVAFAVQARRDLGAGLLPTRPGPATGGARLCSPYGLAWRLHRGALLWWAAAFTVAGVAVGGAAQGAAQMVDDNPQLRVTLERLGGAGSAIDAFLTMVFVYIGIVASLYAIQAVLRLRGEELRHRAEPLLATSVSRTTWTLSHLVFAFGGPVILMAAAGVSAGLVRGVAMHDVAHHVARLLGAALVQLPAVWVLAGIATVVVGLAPRWTPLAWASVVFFALLGEFGTMLNISSWVWNVSPFHHVPQLPGGAVVATPLMWLIAVSGSLVLAGLIGIRRRDVG
jgi:ABC-2 type transport system permease protein